MENDNLRRNNLFSEKEGRTSGISFGSTFNENGATNDNSNKRILTKRKSTFQIDPHSSSTYDKAANNSGWQSYGIFRVLRRKILIDLERQFGRKVEHDRLFSCLGK